MKYAMADIHGDHDRYKKMLELIDLKDDDELYIVGDVIDRHEGGIRILLDMMARENVFPIIGNHEYMMAMCAGFLMQEVTEDSIEKLNTDLMQGFSEWMGTGGDATVSELGKLSGGDREAVIDYIKDFALYEEVRAGENTFLLVHAGLAGFAPERSLDDYGLHELIFKPSDYDRRYFDDRYLVTGHLPTRVIWAKDAGVPFDSHDREDFRDDIYMKNGHIAIDCGCGYDGRLGCVCLDTMEEFYI